MNEVDISSVPADFKLGAIFVNHDEHAYAKVRFDDASIRWFTDNLSKVSSAPNRGAIWRHFWQLVSDMKMSSLQFVDFVKKQLPHETVD